MYVNFESLCFQSKGTRHQRKWVAQVIQPLRMPLLQFLQSSASRTASRLLAERFILTNYSSQDLTIVLIFPGFFPNVITPSIMKQSIEHNIHNPKRRMGGLGTFDGEWMFVII